MTPSSLPASSIRFGRVTLLPGERRILLDDQPARLGGRAFDLLQVLVNHRGEILAKKELLDMVWPGVVVEENNLQVQICALRKLLGPRSIITVPGRGYGFASGIEVKEANASPPPAPRSAHANGHRSPTLTPLRGRETEAAALERLLPEHRLVMVAGPGGVGKTRLVQAVLASPAAGPVRTAEFALMPPRTSVSSWIARAVDLGFMERASARQLASTLGSRNMTLVLENVEHVLDEVGDVANALLDEAPGVRLVCTSLAPLKMRGEHVLRLFPLALPLRDDASAAQSPAVQVFFDTVSALQRREAFTDGELHEAVAICRHLDGLPLALELAGARVPMLGVTGVRRLLPERFRMLTVGSRGAVPRHRSLLACMEWSWSLLDPQEQVALSALSRFHGRFTLRMARGALGAIAQSDWHVMETLGGLVDKSMIIADAGSRSAFRLLESTRLFAQQQQQQPPFHADAGATRVNGGTRALGPG